MNTWNEGAFRFEVSLHLRYRAVRRNGSQLIVWAEEGHYYQSRNTKPDWQDKEPISIERFAQLLTIEEFSMRKPCHGETQQTVNAPVAANSSVR